MFNSSKGVVKSKEVSLYSIEEINDLKSNASNIKRIPINKDGETIQDHTYITFNTLTIQRSIKIGYIIEKVQQYILNCLRCFKC